MQILILLYNNGLCGGIVAAGNNISPEKLYSLTGLSPASAYRLRITAHNSAGSTVATYRFITLNSQGGTSMI